LPLAMMKGNGFYLSFEKEWDIAFGILDCTSLFCLVWYSYFDFELISRLSRDRQIHWRENCWNWVRCAFIYRFWLFWQRDIL
jgi:hypothetical protein